MNSQNILKFWGTYMDLKIDSSEYHDYEISKTESDYNSDVLNINTPINYSGLSVNTTGLTNASCVRNTISLNEFNNTVNDPSYLYSAYTWTLSYSGFTNQLNNSDIILKNDVYEFINSSGETHYFIENGYNNSLSNPFSLNVTGFTTGSTVDCSLQFSGTGITTKICCPRDPIPSAKPWAYQINHGAGVGNCDYSVKRRTEKGWTIDFVLNKNSLPWSDGNVLYYLGVRNESDIKDYADNNLSFSFTNDGRLKWTSIRYSGICNDLSGYTESYYVSSGQTLPLCDNGTSNDFNITITFDRYNRYTDCNIENDGGWNDLIPGVKVIPYVPESGSSETSTQTTIYTEVEELNKKWADEKERRLGILKIYLNGRLVYKLKDWEEVIPSDRGEQPFIQSWGSGTQYAGGVHNLGTSCFNFKKIQFYEQPLDFVHVRHHYLSEIKPNFNIVECNEICYDSVTGNGITNITINALITGKLITLIYDVTLNNELPYSVTVSFKNKLKFSDLTTITVPISFTIPPNETNYQYTHTENYIYSNLDFTYFEFLDFKIDTISGVSFTVSDSFTFEPKTQLYVYVGELIGSNNWGAATFNFNDVTATTIDLSVSKSYNLNNLLPLQNSGYGYQFVNNNNEIVIFTDSFNNELDRYISTSGNTNFYDLDGRWILHLDFANGVITYSNGFEVYTYNYDVLRYNPDVQWDYDSTISDTSFFVIFYDIGQSTNNSIYRFKNDGTQVLIKTWSNNDFISYDIHSQYNSDFYVIQKLNTNGGRYVESEIFGLDDSLLETISFSGDAYNNIDYGFVGTNKYFSISYSNNDNLIDYFINYYNHNTNSFIQTYHDRGVEYENLIIKYDSDFYPSDYGKENLLLSFYNLANNYNGWGYEVSYWDLMYIFGDQTSFTTYTYTLNETKIIVPFIDQIGTNIYRTRIDESGVAKLLTITSSGVTTTNLDINVGDILLYDYYFMDDRTVFSIMDNSSNYYSTTLYLVGANGNIQDNVNIDFTNPYGNVNSTSRAKTFYYGYLSTTGYTAFYLNDTKTKFTETEYYNFQSIANPYLTSNFIINSNIVLYNYGNNTARVLTPTTISSQISMPSWVNYRSISVGEDKFMFIYDDGNGYYHVKLYNFDGNLLKTLDTTFTTLNDFNSVKDRFVVRFFDNSNNRYVMYMITSTNTSNLLLDNFSIYGLPNDFISWDFLIN